VVYRHYGGVSRKIFVIREIVFVHYALSKVITNVVALFDILRTISREEDEIFQLITHKCIAKV
jgi:hypothetical protein